MCMKVSHNLLPVHVIFEYCFVIKNKLFKNQQCVGAGDTAASPLAKFVSRQNLLRYGQNLSKDEIWAKLIIYAQN